MPGIEGIFLGDIDPGRVRGMARSARKVKPAQIHTDEPPYAISAKAAATQLRIHRRIVLTAKAAGCSAFRDNGRVHVGELREWLRHHPEAVHGGRAEAVIDGLKSDNLKLRNDKLETEVIALKRAYVPVETLKQWVAEAKADVRRILSALHRKAHRFVGLDVPACEIELKSREDAIMERLHLMDTEPQDQPISQILTA